MNDVPAPPSPPAPDGSDELFRVAPRPPRTHYWPKRARLKRTRQLKIRAIAGSLLREGPHLRDPKYKKILIACAINTDLLERCYAAIADAELINPETGELRGSIDTIGRLTARQVSLLEKLGLTPTTATAMALPDFDAALERVQKAYVARHGEEVEDVETPDEG